MASNCILKETMYLKWLSCSAPSNNWRFYDYLHRALHANLENASGYDEIHQLIM
jgi:hypothetical protein